MFISQFFMQLHDEVRLVSNQTAHLVVVHDYKNELYAQSLDEFTLLITL